MALSYPYEPTYSIRGWFDPILTAAGWFDRGFSETAAAAGEPTGWAAISSQQRGAVTLGASYV